MNADLKRVRESSLDGGPSSSKRRAVSQSAGGSSPASSHTALEADDDGVEDWMRVVETKRKEAIYRQMLQYRRAYEREQSRAAALERQQRAFEASVQGYQTCWAQLVSSIRDRAGRTSDLPEAQVMEFDTSAPQSEWEALLEKQLSATMGLVSVFAETASGRPGPLPSSELEKRVAQLQSKTESLQAKASRQQSEIDQLRETRDTYQSELHRAEKRLDRQKMEFDKEREGWQTQRESTAAASASASVSKPMANGSGHSTPNPAAAAAEPESKVGSPQVVSAPEDVSDRITELEGLLATRQRQLEDVQAENVNITQELDRVKVLAHHPSEAALREAPFFQVYLQQLAANIGRADAAQERFEQSERKLDQLRDSNLEFREAVLAESRQEVESLRQTMSKKDTDLARIRGARDDLQGQLNERAAADNDKERTTKGLETLCKAREDRIVYLVSEVRRLKGKLAAQDGAEGYLAFLKTEDGVDGDYIKNLEERLAAANDQVAALTAQIESLAAGGAAAAAAESAVRTELESAKRLLQKYERILGDSPDIADDVKQLAARLEQETEAKRKLELKVSEAEESTNALYTEVEGISKLWEGLEQTLRSQVFAIKDNEAMVKGLQTERAKANNKYFQAMRAKEAIEAECKTAQRSVDKQSKLLERAQEVEKALNNQLAQQEQGITTLKNATLELQTQLATVTSEKAQLEHRLQHSQSVLSDTQQQAKSRDSQAVADKNARTKAQEDLEAAQKTVKKLRTKQDTLLAASASGNANIAAQTAIAERDKCMKLLKCSCCDLNFKQQVIVKCMHTFCKECLDSRIASRQRKCPACGIAFAKEDCQTLYWQ